MIPRYNEGDSFLSKPMNQLAAAIEAASAKLDSHTMIPLAVRLFDRISELHGIREVEPPAPVSDPDTAWKERADK